MRGDFLCLLAMTLCFCNNLNSQSISIPDENFKNALVNHIDPVIDTNGDNEIQISEAEAVTKLFISRQNIASLEGIKHFTNLFSLFCDDNQIEDLDLSNNPISVLFASNNPKLETIKLKNNETTFFANNSPLPPNGTSSLFNCPNLIFICADEGEDLIAIRNHIEALGYENCAVSSDCSILDEAFIDFPDDKFKNALINQGVDLNSDNEIQGKEALRVTSLWLSSTNQIQDLTGIAYFLNLKSLSIFGNRLTSLDLNSNQKLSYLNCASNLLTNLQIESCTDLERLNIYENNLTQLNVSNFANLQELRCFANQITDLVLGDHPKLKELSCFDNKLTSLHLSQAQNLERLHCYQNQLATLNIESLSKLNTLDCSNNPISSLNLETNGALLYFDSNATNITSLNFSFNPFLALVSVMDGKLQELIFNNNAAVQRVECSGNELSELATNGIPNVKFLDCKNNNLQSLKIDHQIIAPLELLAENNPNLYCVEVEDPDAFFQNNAVYLDVIAKLSVNCSADDDADGVLNFEDQCRETPSNVSVDAKGCSTDENLDDDLDGIKNGIDKCPETQAGESVNQFGCPLSQIVYLPDPILKRQLLNRPLIDTNNDDIPESNVDLNGDGDIQISEARNATNLLFTGPLALLTEYRKISNLTGLDHFVNLVKLDFGSMDFGQALESNGNETMTNYNFTNLKNLEHLFMNYGNSNVVKNIDLSGLDKLATLSLIGFRSNEEESATSFTEVNLQGCLGLTSLSYYNSWLKIDFCEIPNLISLQCNYLEGGEPDVFDFSCLESLEELNISENEIKTLILKNGSVLKKLMYDEFGDLGINYPYPNYICVDDIEAEYDIISGLIGPNTVVNDYCSFTPGGTYYTVFGKSQIDSENNGCDANDFVFPNLKLKVSNNGSTGEFIANNSGQYDIKLQEGSHVLTPILENPDYFSINPSSVTAELSSSNTNLEQNFCLTPIPGIKDLEISVIPLDVARPGFDSQYKILYKNKGTSAQSGTINLQFNTDLMKVIESAPVASSQNSNILRWDYNNLKPFECRAIDVTFKLNTPTDPVFPLNADDILSFNASIGPATGDHMPNDNDFELNQTVVNSFDPNDKTCLEGTIITSELIGEFVHYIIRFENLGTASAINIVVKDVIDLTRFDISSLVITDASHDFFTRIKDENTVEFIFENINLPFEDDKNDGYITFKIKTLSSLMVGDIFENKADIFFDYNAPIVTNIAATTIEQALSVDDELTNDDLKMFPNPSNDHIYFETKQAIKSVVLYSVSGRLIRSRAYIGNRSFVDFSTENMAAGTYIVKIMTDKGSVFKKLIKK